MQSLSAIGNPVAWLFAEPKNGGVNGFTLTGGIFNYTADMKFHGTGNRATLKFVFQGLDAFGYLRYFVGGEISQNTFILSIILVKFPWTLQHLLKRLKHFHEFQSVPFRGRCYTTSC